MFCCLLVVQRLFHLDLSYFLGFFGRWIGAPGGGSLLLFVNVFEAALVGVVVVVGC